MDFEIYFYLCILIKCLSLLGNDLLLCCKKFFRYLVFNSIFEEEFYFGVVEKI